MILSILLALLTIYIGSADPTGADITYNATSALASGTPGNRTDARGTITTIILDAVQQDQHWKGYVGNVSAVLTLDDVSGNTIYDWDLTGVTMTGRVFAVRVLQPNFTSVQCAVAANILAEETFHNMTSTDVDSINSTFTYKKHDAFTIGIDSIAVNSCNSTATFVNDTRQNMSAATAGILFQELLLEDGSNNILYTTIIEDDTQGFTLTANESFDFQLILPESNVKPSPTTYYFFTEIGS